MILHALIWTIIMIIHIYFGIYNTNVTMMYTSSSNSDGKRKYVTHENIYLEYGKFSSNVYLQFYIIFRQYDTAYRNAFTYYYILTNFEKKNEGFKGITRNVHFLRIFGYGPCPLVEMIQFSINESYNGKTSGVLSNQQLEYPTQVKNR